MKFKIGDKILYKTYFIDKTLKAKVCQVAPLKIMFSDGMWIYVTPDQCVLDKEINHPHTNVFK